METSVVIAFSIPDLFILVGCAISVLHAIPKEMESDTWKRIVAWIGYGVLAVLMPRVFRNDILTTLVMTLYYVGIGRLIYYKNKIGIFYQIIFW